MVLKNRNSEMESRNEGQLKPQPIVAISVYGRQGHNVLRWVANMDWLHPFNRLLDRYAEAGVLHTAQTLSLDYSTNRTR